MGQSPSPEAEGGAVHITTLYESFWKITHIAAQKIIPRIGILRQVFPTITSVFDDVVDPPYGRSPNRSSVLLRSPIQNTLRPPLILATSQETRLGSLTTSNPLDSRLLAAALGT